MENKERSERIRCAAAGLKLRFGINPLKKLALLDPSSRIPERRATLIDFEPEGERNHECIS
jgi:hypothetical protein